jgi:hypothetical protein
MATNFVTGAAPRALPLVGHALPLIRRPVEFLDSLPPHGDLVEIRTGPTSACLEYALRALLHRVLLLGACRGLHRLQCGTCVCMSMQPFRLEAE